MLDYRRNSRSLKSPEHVGRQHKERQPCRLMAEHQRDHGQRRHRPAHHKQHRCLFRPHFVEQHAAQKL